MTPTTPEEPREVEIDGAHYIIGRLAPRRALKLQNRLVRVLGPAILPFLDGGLPLGEDGHVDMGKIDTAVVGKALQGVMSVLSPEEQDAIMAELFSTVAVVGSEKAGDLMPIFNAHFMGRLPAVWKLMWACLEEQFGGFFELLAAAANQAALASRVSKASATSPTSGSSGASS